MMGGGGGHTSSFRPSSDSVRRQVDEMLQKERDRLATDIQNYLAELLSKFNSRDADADRRRLEQLAERLGEGIELEAILLGGSVAKHTAVDGVSDVDALVVLDGGAMKGKSPQEVLDHLRAILQSKLRQEEVSDIRQGGMAVTVVYDDGREIQLVPVVRTGDKYKISDATHTTWKEADPAKFDRALTTANKSVDGSLVRAIKLLKAINDSLPVQKQMTGYHIEALAIDAVKEYSGPKIVKSVLERIIDHSITRVMAPIRDITGQSRIVDDYLGSTDSLQRQNISQAMASVRRRFASATSVADWKSVFEG